MFGFEVLNLLELSLGRIVLFNAFGVIGICLQILLYQMKKRKTIILFNIANNVTGFSYFSLQGDLLSGTANIVGIVSNLVFLCRGKYRWAESKLWLLLFIAIGVTYSIFTFKTWRDIFPLVGCASSMVAFFMIKEKNIRKVSLFTYTCFMCNSISKLYIVALIADITAFSSVVIALIRYSKKEEREEVESVVQTQTE